MRKQLLSALFLGLVLSCGSVLAQNMFLTNYTLNMSGTVNDPPLDSYVTIQNNGTGSMDVSLERTSQTLAPGHFNNFCFITSCWGFNVTYPPTPASIAGGSADNSFKSQLNHFGNAGSSTVTYRFYDVNNPSDSASLTFGYDITLTSSVSENAKSYIATPRPNPADNFTLLSYKLYDNNVYRLDVYNMLGTKVLEIPITKKQGVLMVETRDLNNGIYFCSLMNNGKQAGTTKLIVSHK